MERAFIASQNTVIGIDALSQADEPYNNIAIGNYAMEYSSVGSDNVVIEYFGSQNQ